MGYAGQGTPQHIGIELFKAMAGVDLTLVPYLGSTPALNDLLAGSIDAMFDPMPSSIAHIKSGKLVPLAVTTLTRSANLPDVPVAADTVPGYQAGSWFGIGAPRATPSAVIDKLNAAVNAALAVPIIKERLSELGAIELPSPAAEFQTFIAQETERYAGVIRSAGISLNRVSGWPIVTHCVAPPSRSLTVKSGNRLRDGKKPDRSRMPNADVRRRNHLFGASSRVRSNTRPP